MARRASLEDFADPQLQDRRRSVGLAKKITASIAARSGAVRAVGALGPRAGRERSECRNGRM